MTASNAASFDPTAQAFDRFAADFDRFAELVGGPLDAYLHCVVPECGGRAVDLGCGSGHHAAMLAPRFGEVLGVDVSAPMLELARVRRNLPNVRYQHRDLRSVCPEIDGRFDLVLSAYALHHVEDLDQALEGIRRLVAPGGRVVLIDNVAPRPAVPRWWFHKEAVRLLAADLLARRRPVAEAVELYRLNTSPAWLDHLVTDRFLHPDEFDRRTGRVFPGARYAGLYRARALCWDAPTRRAARPEHRVLAQASLPRRGP